MTKKTSRMTTQRIVIDFEMNPVSKTNEEAKSQLYREIIEIGAVKLDENLCVIDRFRCYVKPQFNDEITPFITRLTGISSYDVFRAKCFEDALLSLENWIGYKYFSMIYSWSLSDLNQLKNECCYKHMDFPKNMNDWVDFQELYAEAMDCPSDRKQMSLHNAAEQFGISMDSKATHSALYDAEITTELVVSVLSGDYKRQSELLKESYWKETDYRGSRLGDSCGGVLMQLLKRMNEKQDYAYVS